MKADNREQYVKAWTEQIMSFSNVGSDAENWEGYTSLKRQAVDLISQAADKLFPAAVKKEPCHRCWPNYNNKCSHCSALNNS